DIRYVVRNTGHDYNGRSAGAGALSVWTHDLRSTAFFNFKDAYYTGKTLQMGAQIGAGVQGFDAIATAKESNLVIVEVGVSGGYTQGGGHSALSTSFGLSADNALSFDVVLASGSLVAANRSSTS
ncbi:hypothetical protein BJ878DRAFT_425923, partial [Calycina marina]